MRKRIISPDFIDEVEQGNTLRPQRLQEYIGQSKNIEQLKIFLEACEMRDKPLDHVLLYGPPGLGKTTLAGIIANELGVNFKVTSGPAIERTGDLAAILSSLQERDILFIDEIHRLNRTVEEVLYPAMEDYALDIVIGKGPMAKSIRIDLAKFTLIGATTRAGDLSSPLRDRFGVIMKMDLYTNEELQQIIRRSADVLELQLEDNACMEIAKRSRGTPRIVNRLLKRVGDYAIVENDSVITLPLAKKALSLFEIDELGLDGTDINLLTSIIHHYDGGPIGIDTIAASIGEEKRTIEDVYEPYLMQIGFLKRTPRGRVVLKRAYDHLGISYNENQFEQLEFDWEGEDEDE